MISLIQKIKPPKPCLGNNHNCNPPDVPIDSVYWLVFLALLGIGLIIYKTYKNDRSNNRIKK